VLRLVRPLTSSDAASQTRRARYTAGQLADTGGADGRVVPAYVEEKGVDPKRETETFAEIVLELDSWRWSGTRFVLRTGKALSRRRKEAVLRFRPVPHLPFGDAAAKPAVNELRIGLDGPYGIALHLTGIETGPPPHLAPMILDAELSAPELPAYSRVLMNVLTGDSALSIRGDEAEQAWRIVTPVLEAWADGRVPMEEYRAGSDGPPSKAKF
jgi:glucose-6-phosphate 1-dehydrogenase